MTVKEAAKTFDEQRKRCKMMYIFYGIGMIVALAFMFLQEMKSALLIFVIMLLIYFLLVRSGIKQYTARWREYCVRKFTEPHFEPVTYSYRVKAAEEELFLRHVMMPQAEKGKLIAHNKATGSNAGIDAVFMDATVTTGSFTGTRFHSGCWMGMKLDSKVTEPLRIVKGEILSGSMYEDWLTESEGMRKCETPENMPEDVAFYSASGKAELEESMQFAVRELLREIPGTGIVELDAEGLFVFLPHRLINKLPPSLKFPVTEEMIEQVTFPEIDKAYMLALTMRRKRLASGNEEQA